MGKQREPLAGRPMKRKRIILDCDVIATLPQATPVRRD
jgi:hypothetical protein